MHRVCICVEHQNVKLMMNALPTKIDYKTLLEMISCNIENRNCMLRSCELCPSLDILESHLIHLFRSNDYDENSLVKYREWLQTDTTDLHIHNIELLEFINILINKLDKIKAHYFITQFQSSYLKSIKDNLDEKTAIVLLDYSENYSFIYQDAIQSVHWENVQTTVHPIAVYYKINNEMKVTSFCILSDYLTHNTSAVHSFIKILLDHIKINFVNINHIIYYSDGAASQYKNYKNMINLCMHNTDFNLTVEWHFFATSHGKSPCDGIGGTVKRLVDRSSKLDRILINNPNLMYQYCRDNIKNIVFFILILKQF